MDEFNNTFKNFDKFVNINVYINNFFFIDNENEKFLNLKINISNFEYCKENKCDILKKYIEDKVKKHLICKIKEKCTNIVDISKKFNIPIKNVLYSYFINNRIDNIEIIWSSSAIKEFEYVPIQHYLNHQDDVLYLKTKKFKFLKKFK